MGWNSEEPDSAMDEKYRSHNSVDEDKNSLQCLAEDVFIPHPAAA